MDSTGSVASMMPAASGATALELIDIDKRFGGVYALRKVSLRVRPGEVLALAGENGAGKSTLVGVASGRIEQDAGDMFVDGRPFTWGGPHAAAEAGIRLVPQELMLCPDLTVYENVLLGQLPRVGRVFLNQRAARAIARRRLEQLGVHGDIDIDAPVARLPVVQRAFVQIARSLTPGASVLLIDEPTAPMDARAVESFMNAVKALTASGVAIVYISHRLEEIFQLADRICVMRDGMMAAELTATQMTQQNVINAMVGGRELRALDAAPRQAGEPALVARGLAARGLVDVSLTVAVGEVLAVYGISGSGREQLGSALVGATKRTGGSVEVGGTPLKRGSVADAVAHGLGYVPAERRSQGLDLEASVASNLTLAMFRTLARLGFVRKETLERAAAAWIESLRIRTPSAATRTGSLSGGSQQKVLLARWLAAKSRVLVLEEPTRGVDVATKAEIYNLLHDMARGGAAVLVITSDIEEAAVVTDRVLVMRQGRVAAELHRPSQADLARAAQSTEEPAHA